MVLDVAGRDTMCYVLCVPKHVIPRFALSEGLEAQGGWGPCPSSRKWV